MSGEFWIDSLPQILNEDVQPTCRERTREDGAKESKNRERIWLKLNVGSFADSEVTDDEKPGH